MTEFDDAFADMQAMTRSQSTSIYNREHPWTWETPTAGPFVNGRPAAPTTHTVTLRFKAWDPSKATDRRSIDFMATNPERDTWLGEFKEGQTLPAINATTEIPEGTLTLTTLQTPRRSTLGTPFIAKLSR